MSTTVMAAVWPLQLPPVAKSVLISLADNANDSGYCWPSLETIVERTCFGRTAVINAIKWLEANNVIEVKHSPGKGRSNGYTITPDRFRGDVTGDYHYTYKITHVPTGSFYIGLRSCGVDPEKDAYFGSGKACEWLSSVKIECQKEVISIFAEREMAAEHESALVSENIENPLCLNRRKSTPNQAMAHFANNDLKGAPRVPFASRTVRLADVNSSPRVPLQSATRTLTVKNRKEPSYKTLCADLPECIAPDVWAMWHEYRVKKSGKAWTEHAQQLAVKSLVKIAEAGHDIRAVVETSIERGYAGLFAPKSNGENYDNPRESLADRAAKRAVAIFDRLDAQHDQGADKALADGRRRMGKPMDIESW